ncbi:MAG: trimethylamine methyltransferase family protein [Candidatus Bathyarchaeota archaeon]
MSKESLDTIHSATIEVLEKTGVIVESDKALKILEEAGCTVNHRKHLALIPSHLVKEALTKAPRNVTLYARNPKNDLRLDGEHTYLCTDGSGTYTIDPKTGDRRASTKRDLSTSAKIVDYLDVIGIYWPMITSQDVPAHVRVLHDLEASLANTEKHVMFETTITPDEARFQIEMAALVAGGKDELKESPIISSCHCSISPLKHAKGPTEAAIEFAKAGVPVYFLPMPQAGATSPITLAGSLVVSNAEMLSGLVIVQILAPGAPMLYSSESSNFDMKNLRWCGGSPECGLMTAVSNELAEYYHMPSTSAGFTTDAKVPGAQACYEKAVTGALPVLAGHDVVGGLGLLDACTVFTPEQIIIDVEIGRMLHRLAQGIDINEETLALDVIHKIGPGGNYFTEKHTLKHLEKAHYTPEISDRRSYETWKKAGSETTLKIAREKAQEILETHQPAPLEKDIQKGIAEILKRAEKELAGA